MYDEHPKKQKTLVTQYCTGLSGTLGPGMEHSIPGDKSISHRAALFGSLADGVSTFSNFLDSGVTQAMLAALSQFGIRWEMLGKTLRIEGVGIQGLRVPQSSINCGNSGTTMRLLAGAVAASGIPVVLDGTPGLQKRPMNRIVEPLSRMGVKIHANNGHAPLKMGRGELPLKPIEYLLPVASAQVKSCLLLAALSADGDTVLTEPGPSRNHTELMLENMGATINDRIAKSPPSTSSIAGTKVFLTELKKFYPSELTPVDYNIPGDISSASFIIVAASITPDSAVTLHNIGLNPTRTGLIDALLLMGADLVITNTSEHDGEMRGSICVKSSRLSGIEVGGELVVRMIDEFPIFAIAAACAEGKTIVKEASELRHKESDRIKSLVTELKKIGVNIVERGDGFEINGKSPIRGTEVDHYGDHRLAMSLAVAGLVSKQPVYMNNAGIIFESFPEFPDILKHLNARVG